MISLGKILFSVYAISYFAVRVRSIGETMEKSYFREYRPGYLFCVGTRRYLSFHQYDEDLFLDTEQKNQMAAKLYARIISDEATPYALLTSGEDKHLSKCKVRHASFNTGKKKQYIDCPSLYVSKKSKNVVKVKPFDKDSSFKLMFSLPVLPRYHAVRVMHNKKCLTARASGELGVDECEYEDVFNRSNQLFIWVDEDMFSTRYDPLRELDQSKNPANPYYVNSGDTSRSVW